MYFARRNQQAPSPTGIEARAAVLALRASLSAMVVCACCASIKNVGAADPTAGSKASTSRASRDAAAQAVPLEQIRPDMRDRVAAVVNNPSIFRRLPTASIQCDRDLYLLLIRNPEIVIDIWQMMGITNMSLVRTGPERFSAAADGQGTTGMLEIVYRSADTHVIYSTGTYDGSLSPAKIRGESVVVLKSEYFQDADGHQRVNSRLDVFLHLDNVGIEWIAKTLQPLLGKTADHNFAETASFVASLSRTAESNPAGIARLSNRLPHVDPTTRRRFAEVSELASERADSARAPANGPSAERTTMRVAPATAQIHSDDADSYERR